MSIHSADAVINDYVDPSLGEIDPVKEYLKQAGETGLLSSEEEHALALRIQNGDFDAKNELICANLRLVISIAKKYAAGAKNMDLLDLVQEGNLGLMKAADRYDPSLGFRFSTYATWWIRQSITRGIADQDRLIRLPVHVGEDIRKVYRASQAVELASAESGDDYYDEIAEQTGISSEKVEYLLQLSQPSRSLDTPIDDEQTSTLGAFIEDETIEAPDQVVMFSLMREEIAKQLSTLTTREETVINLRFGLNGGRPHTLEEIGNRIGVTRERIRQIECKALRKLRHPKRGKYLRDFIS